MTDELSERLFWFANLSSFYAVLTVVVVFVLMVIFIVRLNYDLFPAMNSSPICHVNMTTEKQVRGVVNPFFLTIDTDKENSLQEGLHVKLSLMKSGLVNVCWGTDLEAFHKALRDPWQDLLEKLELQTWLQNNCLFVNLQKRFNPVDNMTLHFPCPEEITAYSLGPNPRNKYPVVVIIFLTDLQLKSGLKDISPPEVIALFSVIHLKDEICQLDTQILGQYLKTSTDTVVELQPLFVSSSDKEDFSEESSSSNRNLQKNSDFAKNMREYTEDNCNTCDHGVQCGSTCECYIQRVQNNPKDNTVSHNVQTSSESDRSLCRNRRNGTAEILSPSGSSVTQINGTQTASIRSKEEFGECIICQACPVAFAVLPCRHACTCEHCFPKLDDKCPMCRGYITSFFRTRNLREINDSDLADSENIQTDIVPQGRWERFNHRINEFFGFS